ncbi:hypothetical protein [Mycobacterium spongiae]|uniref:Lysin B n=1 Tax=Mycobacterium spongiae TaxID=886343 RepID=A0A975JUW3_9MYCO|nr:hypothetical protein [Mycobacterium spongiae]QUR66137.1 hypothetical protein F6B93_02710 [Mycobacterium spongiae]
MGFKMGSSGPEVGRWQEFMRRKFASYSEELPVDEHYGYFDGVVVNEAKRRLGLPQDGVADDDFLIRIGFSAGQARPLSTTWVYSAAGTRAPWSIGPPFEIGEHAKRRGLRHQPVDYPAGGFFGPPDPTMSFNESIKVLRNEWARLLRLNTAGDIVTISYSQGADGMQRATAELFGDGGEFASQRHRLRRAIMVGNPTRPSGPTKIGNDPRGAGIARWHPPDWLQAITFDIVTHYDMYACAEDTTLVPLFYPWFTRAETELSFVAYSAQVIVPTVASFYNIFIPPILGGLFGPLGVQALALVTRIPVDTLNELFKGISGEDPDPELVEALSAKGLLSDIPGLIKSLVALGGIRTHNEYHLPRPEFGNRTGIDVGIGLIDEIL